MAELKEYIVTTLDKVRSSYTVQAENEEEAKNIIQNGGRDYQHNGDDEFVDLIEIENVEENN